jgi:hypothetical protein
MMETSGLTELVRSKVQLLLRQRHSPSPAMLRWAR